MMPRPAIAVLTANVLVGVGLRSILEKAAPAADVELFGDFQSFAKADPGRFIHYFVTAQLFAAHNVFFRAHSHRTIVLTNGQNPAGMHCIDVQADEERFVCSLMRLQHSVHRPEHTLPAQPQAAQPLTEREVEVLTLIAGGLLNKQIADRLEIGLTTVISHRRNIMEKLGIRSAAGLVVYALAAGYVDPDGM
ncbi:helix-turn-helix transcriptional regulator [Alistipes sp.]|uniref:helix-turn-helix transcriptional regulator n=1 Tax=Alistipes sp. TaxID=1872444 RepID=UPI0025C2AF20|nr:helix-turn-helix transcriptional regulator [Alistipes sp.]